VPRTTNPPCIILVSSTPNPTMSMSIAIEIMPKATPTQARHVDRARVGENRLVPGLIAGRAGFDVLAVVGSLKR
jgi:hypothetical protein